MPARLDRRRKLMPQDIALAKRMKSSGKSIALIAQHFACGEKTIEYWVYPNERQRIKKKQAARMRKLRESWTLEDKAKNNARTIDVLMRKRNIQPEYKTYADETHYRYMRTPKSGETRRKYYAENKKRLNEIQHTQYRKHRAKRLASRKIYVAEHLEEIRRKCREYYQKNKEKVLARNRERRAKN